MVIELSLFVSVIIVNIVITNFVQIMHSLQVLVPILRNGLLIIVIGVSLFFLIINTITIAKCWQSITICIILLRFSPIILGTLLLYYELIIITTIITIILLFNTLIIPIILGFNDVLIKWRCLAILYLPSIIIVVDIVRFWFRCWWVNIYCIHLLSLLLRRLFINMKMIIITRLILIPQRLWPIVFQLVPTLLLHLCLPQLFLSYLLQPFVKWWWTFL